MSGRTMRLGLTLPGQGPVSELADQARRAEQLGFDVVLLIDHLGFAAPLPPLVAMAAAAPTLRVSNMVLNARSTGPHCWPGTWPASTQPPAAVSRSAWAPAMSKQNSSLPGCHFPSPQDEFTC